MKPSLLILLLMLLICGCTTIKRYKSAKVENASKVYVAMSVFSTSEIKEEKKEAKNLWTLNGDGQSALINTLDKRFKENEEFKTQLITSYGKTDPVDYIDKKIKLVFSASKLRDYQGMATNDYSLADRIEYLKFTLTLITNQVEFTEWNKFETDYGDIKIADMKSEQSFEPTLGLGNDETEASAEFTGKFQKIEEQNIKYRYIKLNGKLEKRILTAEEEGTREIDLNGNTVIEVTVRFKSVPIYFTNVKTFKDSGGVFLSSEKLAVELKEVLLPQIGESENLVATLNYDYIYRHVMNNRGAKTYFENDDKVTFIQGKGTPEQITLLDLENLKPDRWKLCTNGEILYIFNEKITEKPVDLTFDSLEKAKEFKRWLDDYSKNNKSPVDAIRIGDAVLYWRDKELTGQILNGNLPHIVRVTEVGCTD